MVPDLGSWPCSSQHPTYCSMPVLPMSELLPGSKLTLTHSLLQGAWEDCDDEDLPARGKHFNPKSIVKQSGGKRGRKSSGKRRSSGKAAGKRRKSGAGPPGCSAADDSLIHGCK